MKSQTERGKKDSGSSSAPQKNAAGKHDSNRSETISSSKAKKRKDRLAKIVGASLAGESSIGHSEATIGIAKENDIGLNGLESNKLFDSSAQFPASTHPALENETVRDANDTEELASQNNAPTDAPVELANMESINADLAILRQGHRGGIEQLPDVDIKAPENNSPATNLALQTISLDKISIEGLSANGELNLASHFTAPLVFTPSMTRPLPSVTPTATTQPSKTDTTSSLGQTTEPTQPQTTGPTTPPVAQTTEPTQPQTTGPTTPPVAQTIEPTQPQTTGSTTPQVGQTTEPTQPQTTGPTTPPVAQTIESTQTKPDFTTGATFTQTTIKDALGEFTINEHGKWQFHANEATPQIRHLGLGDKLEHIVKVTDTNGVEHSIQVEIAGKNSGPSISRVNSFTIEEGSPPLSGKLHATDPDQHDLLSYSTVSHVKGFNLNTDGTYSFAAEHTDYAHLFEGEVKVIHIPIIVSDNHGAQAKSILEIKVVGTNDLPTASATNLQTIKEDGLVQGQIQIGDVDNNAQLSSTIDMPVAGLVMNTDGHYTFDASHTAYQSLAEGETLDLHVPVTVTDEHGATAHTQLNIQVIGTNDKAIVVGLDYAINTVSESNAQSINVSGKLSVLDIDSGEAAFSSQLLQGTYGTLSIDESGAWRYSADRYQSALTSLTSSERVDETFTVKTADGTEHNIHIALKGANQAAAIAGVSSAMMKEDMTQSVNGQLLISDPNAGEDIFVAMDIDTEHGHFSIDESGQWQFALNNQHPDIQALPENGSITEKILVGSIDGTPKVIHIKIIGTNDKPIVVNNPAVYVDEDKQVSGTIQTTDIDTGDGVKVTLDMPVAGLTMHEDGSYTFDSTHTDYQHLAEGEKLKLQVPITLTDNVGGQTHSQLTIQIQGSNDKPIIVGVDYALATESDAKNGYITASGDLDVLDLDQGESNFSTQLLSGNYGALSIDENGHWSYIADATQKSLVSLTDGKHVDEAFVVRTVDGTEHTINIRIKGTNQAAVIGGVTSAMLKEDTALDTAKGALSIFDPDTGEQGFIAQDKDTEHGHFSIDESGQWQFALNNQHPDIQALPENGSITEKIVVGSIDGTPQIISINIVGKNDAPVISGIATGEIHEDSTNAISGRLTVQDIDTNASHQFDIIGAHKGTYGSLDIDSRTGDWVYHLDNTKAQTQALVKDQVAHEQFTVVATDEFGAKVQHQISVTVLGTNDIPTISPISDITTKEGDGVVSGQINGFDADLNAVLSFSTDTSVDGFSLDSDGSYTFNPSASVYHSLAEGESKQISIPVTVTDEQGASSSQTLSITVVGINNAPSVTATKLSPANLGNTLEDTSKRFTESELLKLVGASDHESTGSLSISAVNAEHGTFTKESDGTWLFSPAQNFGGESTKVGITVTDGKEQTQAFGELAIEAVADRPRSSMAESVHTSFSNHDPDHQYSGTYGYVSPTQWGWQTDNPDGLVEQGEGAPYGDTSGGNVGIVELEGKANTPSNMYRDIKTQVGAQYHLGFDLTGRTGTSSEGSAVQVIWEGKVIDTIRPTAHTFKFVRHEYDLTASGENSRIEIRAVDHDGTGGVIDNLDLDFEGLTGKEDTDLPIALNLELTDTDGSEIETAIVEGLPLGFSITDGTHSKTVTQAGESVSADGWDLDHLVIRPAPNFNGEVTVVVKAGSQELSNQDTAHVSYPIKLTFTPVDDKPELQNEQVSATEGGALITGHLDATSVDSGVSLSYTLGSAVEGLTLNSDGSYSFDPSNSAYSGLADGQNKQMSVPITVTDSNGLSDTKALVINMTGTNNSPTIQSISPLSFKEDAAIATGTITATDQDTGDTLHFSTSARIEGFTIDEQGNWQFDPSHEGYERLAEGELNNLVIPITVTDGHGGTDTQELHIQVIGTNDIPTVRATQRRPVDMGQLDEDQTKTFSESELLHQAGVRDYDRSDTHHITDITSSAGDFTKQSNRDWLFTPHKDAHGNDLPVSIKISDGIAEVSANAKLSIESVTDTATPDLIVSAKQHVMEFPHGQPSAVVSSSAVQAGSGLSEMTVDMTVLGGKQVTTEGVHGATLISYGTPSDANTFYIWKPEDLTIRLGGHEYATGVAMLNDGQDHRYSFSWDGNSGKLDVLIDGVLAKHMDNVAKGVTIPSGGKLALGNDQDSFGGGFSSSDAFTGKMFNVSIATRALDTDELAKTPMANTLRGDSHLETDVTASAHGIVDSTGKHSYTAVAGVTQTVVEVDTRIASPNAGASLMIKLNAGAPSDADDHINQEKLTGLPAGTVLKDNQGHTYTVTSPTEQIDVSTWDHNDIEAKLPQDFHSNTFVSYLVTTKGPDGVQELSFDNSPVILDKSQDIGTAPDFNAQSDLESTSTVDTSVVQSTSEAVVNEGDIQATDPLATDASTSIDTSTGTDTSNGADTKTEVLKDETPESTSASPEINSNKVQAEHEALSSVDKTDVQETSEALPESLEETSREETQATSVSEELIQTLTDANAELHPSFESLAENNGDGDADAGNSDLALPVEIDSSGSENTPDSTSTSLDAAVIADLLDNQVSPDSTLGERLDNEPPSDLDENTPDLPDDPTLAQRDDDHY
ncbi:VCBS domain-containing protein [Glaciecola siphonariae]|uniref:VCBS domain-containing protein n=1 Tax=Glaciecola siphonariae TaxID=521012 RepID=A0ABV9LUD1_9ALTE